MRGAAVDCGLRGRGADHSCRSWDMTVGWSGRRRFQQARHVPDEREIPRVMRPGLHRLTVICALVSEVMQAQAAGGSCWSMRPALLATQQLDQLTKIAH